MRNQTLFGAALGLMALTAPLAMAQIPNRFVTATGSTWGYVQNSGAAVLFTDTISDFGPGQGFRAGLNITILTRDGAPVTQADRNDAWYAASEVCRATRRRFDTGARGIMLQRGGIRFPGNCT